MEYKREKGLGSVSGDSGWSRKVPEVFRMVPESSGSVPEGLGRVRNILEGSRRF
jgi:hypothetical protein